MTTPPPAHCPACHAPLSEGARFCHRCGRALVGSGADRTPWMVAWSLVAISVAGILFWVFRDQPAPVGTPDMSGAPPAAEGGSGAPPDISQMGPEERFLRLHDRVMAAEEKGDSATAQMFAPMAIQAYGMLGQVDADMRYHAAALNVVVKDFPAALALADTIAREAPTHLFASLIRAEVAEAKGDRAGYARERRAFLDNYDREIAAARPEYREHQAMLTDLKTQFGTP